LSESMSAITQCTPYSSLNARSSLSSSPFIHSSFALLVISSSLLAILSSSRASSTSFSFSSTAFSAFSTRLLASQIVFHLHSRNSHSLIRE
ncbi:hypothetical protein PMAYCL1PPCAC_02057, partial [Pristionchus mayeri]